MQTPRKRFRTPRSCQECRRRKVKCDRQFPCCHCTLSDKVCSYSAGLGHATLSHGKSHPPSASAVSGSTLAEESETVLDLTSGAAQTYGLAKSDISIGTQETESTGVPVSSTSASVHSSETTDLRLRVQRLEQLLSKYADAAAPADLTNSKLSSISSGADNADKLPDRQIALNKSRLYGATHWTYVMHECQKTAEFFNHELETRSDTEAIRRLKAEIRTLVQGCKVLARNMKASRPSRRISTSETRFLERDCADQMARLYTSHFESAFRILHIPSFWADYSRYWENPAAAEPTLKFRVQLAVAIGCSISLAFQNSPNIRSAAFQTVHEAQNWLSGPLEKDRVSVAGLQIQCLTILARQTIAIGGDLVWIAIGTLIRTAIHLGLHRDPRHFGRMTVLQREIRRRLWATIIEMNLQASLDTGVPPNFSLDDFDTEIPSNIDDNDIDELTKSIEPQPESALTSSAAQRFLFEHMQPRLEMLHRMNGLTSNLTPEEVVTLSSKINNACRQSANAVGRGNHTEGEVFKFNMMDFLLRRFLLCLHRPWVSRKQENAWCYASRKICFNSATSLLYPKSDEEFSRLLIVGSGMFKTRIIHVSLALVSELLIENEEEGVDLEEPSRYKKLLIDAVVEARSQAAQRIQLGETNVRLFMKLGMILCQVVGAETGIPLRLRMAQSAKESLETAYSMIQGYSGSTGYSVPAGQSLDMLQDGDQGEFSFNLFDLDDFFRFTDLADDMFYPDQSKIVDMV